MNLACCIAEGSTAVPVSLRGEEAARWIVPAGPGVSRIEFIVPGANCAACMPEIERALRAIPGVTVARLNLTGRRVAVTWRDGETEPQAFVDALAATGYAARPFDPRETGLLQDDTEGAMLLRALAVAGFAAGNIMLLSVSVWSGAEAATRDLFHWLSALIALPTVAYAGRPFFRSAAAALRHGRVNMDVPISLGVTISAAMSLFETFNGGRHAYFDASVTLLFFLLAGRYLDHMMRARARSAVMQLVSLANEGATVVAEDGSRRYVAARDLSPGMRIAVAAGDRLPADGAVELGSSDLDRSLVTGETAYEAVGPGDHVHSGVLNVTGPLVVRVTAAGGDTFLAELIRLMTAAEQGQSRYVRLADRLARYYSPVVHVLAGGTLAGWLVAGAGWHPALMAAVAVLIITCPCALGLAVPAVQVVASGKLFRAGVMIKDGGALEKLALIDTVILDKTGTMTLGRPQLVSPAVPPADMLAVAAGLARTSRHPLSQALVREAESRGLRLANVDDASEHPGFGLEGRWRGQELRLGRRAWCGVPETSHDEGLLEIVFRIGEGTPLVFAFEDRMRPGASETVAELKRQGIDVRLLTGDREAAARRVAAAAGIERVVAGATPQDKLAVIQSLAEAGRKTLMVGDGINDAPALAAGFTSMAPASASDIGRTAAESVFMGESLSAVAHVRRVAVAAQSVARQNLGLALAYNLLAVPLAVAGLVSPLLAAVAMSSSSIIVIANALRLGAIRLPRQETPERLPRRAVPMTALKEAA